MEVEASDRGVVTVLLPHATYMDVEDAGGKLVSLLLPAVRPKFSFNYL
jgi:hypothetical protein